MTNEILNIFQIWDKQGRKVPFKVRRENWHPRYEVIVEKIECEKLPYGKAFGHSTEDGKSTDFFNHDSRYRKTGEIPCAGSYQWYSTKNENNENNEKLTLF